jgi:hypothetical protein
MVVTTFARCKEGQSGSRADFCAFFVTYENSVLDMISTHPALQHRGAGSMLVKWGTDIADSVGAECFIEGTLIARPLYGKNGFVVTPNDWIEVPVPEKWKSRPEIRYCCYSHGGGGSPDYAAAFRQNKLVTI